MVTPVVLVFGQHLGDDAGRQELHDVGPASVLVASAHSHHAAAASHTGRGGGEVVQEAQDQHDGEQRSLVAVHDGGAVIIPENDKYNISNVEIIEIQLIAIKPVLFLTFLCRGVQNDKNVFVTDAILKNPYDFMYYYYAQSCIFTGQDDRVRTKPISLTYQWYFMYALGYRIYRLSNLLR